MPLAVLDILYKYLMINTLVVLGRVGGEGVGENQFN